MSMNIFLLKATSYQLMQDEKIEEQRLQAANINPYTPQYVIQNNMGGCHSWISPFDKKWFFKYV